MKAQLFKQCVVPRSLFGGVESTSKSVYSSDSQLLLSRPSVNDAYLRNKQGFYRHQLYYFHNVAAAFFVLFSVSAVLFLVRSRYGFFFSPSNLFYVEQKEST